MSFWTKFTIVYLFSLWPLVLLMAKVVTIYSSTVNISFGPLEPALFHGLNYLLDDNIQRFSVLCACLAWGYILFRRVKASPKSVFMLCLIYSLVGIIAFGLLFIVFLAVNTLIFNSYRSVRRL